MSSQALRATLQSGLQNLATGGLRTSAMKLLATLNKPACRASSKSNANWSVRDNRPP
jgi:hypothetical protein